MFIAVESFSVVEVEADSSDDDEDSENARNVSCEMLTKSAYHNNIKERTASVDSHSRVSSVGSIHGVSKCVMCGKEFQHNANLRIHLQSHLGTRAQLKSCDKCDR